MTGLIIQEIDLRIDRLMELRNRAYKNQEELACIQSRLIELESLKAFTIERMGTKEKKKLSNNEFWRLIDEF